MHKIEILIPPIAAPETRAVRSALLQPDLQEFDIANRVESGYDYERKICLTDGGAVLQVMSKDANGDITVALPQDAYDLSDPIRVLLMDVNGDGTYYRLRIQLGGADQHPALTSDHAVWGQPATSYCRVYPYSCGWTNGYVGLYWCR